MKTKKRLCVFASGRGSNFEFILKKIKQNRLNAEIVLMVSNNPEAVALLIAAKNGIRCEVISKEGSSDKLLGLLQSMGIDLIVLAGYLRKIPDEIIKAWSNRIVNIHPALLPSFGGKGFYGIHVHEAVISSGTKFSGVTVHFVNNEFDTGPIILQSVVPVFDSDDAQALQKRVLKIEHEVFWKAIKLVLEKRIQINGLRVISTK